jgi:hypothetical protein
MDFTLKIYRQLLVALQNKGYSFFAFEEYCLGEASGKYVILRHDVDLRAGQSLATAKIEAALGIRASYYFRVVPQSNQPDIISAIAALGHEIGYHYEDMSLFKGDADKALAHFQQQLAHFRQFYPVKTICMHGSPTSKYDNKDLWKTYNYRDYGIIGEPYFDVDFNKVFYLTDTGRMWDGDRYSVRDRVETRHATSLQEMPASSEQQVCKTNFHSTGEVIKGIEANVLPSQIMITTHPQRWTDNKVEWLQELVMQRMKNVVKRLIVGNG